MTYDRAIRKDAFYWYQANWSKRPMLHLTSSRMQIRTQRSAAIKVYSNLPDVTLKINGRILSTVAVDDHIAKWTDVVLREGVNEIEVQGTAEGRTISDRAVWQVVPSASINLP